MKQICKHFFTLNKDIITSTDLELLLEFINYDDLNTDIIGKYFSKIFTELFKTISHKILLVIDEHRALFDGKISVPDQLPSLAPLKYLTY